MKTEKVEYERQIAVAEKQIIELEALHIKLEEQRGRLNIDQLSEAKRIRMEQDEIHGKISDLKLLRDLAREQIAKWEKSAPAAGKIIKEVAAWYDETRTFVERIIESQAQVAGYLQEIETRNNKIGPAEHEYQLLTGESMEAPGRIVVYQALGFAGSNVERVKPWSAWTFISETNRRAAYAEELEKKLQAHEVRIKVAEQYAPMCENCARANVESKMIVDRGSGHSDSPGQAGSGHSSHHWHFVCPKCGATMTQPIPETKK